MWIFDDQLYFFFCNVVIFNLYALLFLCLFFCTFFFVCFHFLLWSLFFFFFKQKTAYEMRISDWSSDVCSSDLWGFDGSSTLQAEGHSSDCVLKPVAVYPDPARTNGVLVMCEVMLPDGVTPHPSNSRATIFDDEGAWFGFEQEYFFYEDGRPLGFPEQGYPAPQGPYYTGVGYKNVGSIACEIVEEHLDLCLAAGINHEGINAEVAKGQWEFQVFGKGSKKAADQIWMARYLLLRLCEKYGIDIEFHCKPLGDTDWNGSGMHCNFSTH